jgi:hypothetical protein
MKTEDASPPPDTGSGRVEAVQEAGPELVSPSDGPRDPEVSSPRETGTSLECSQDGAPAADAPPDEATVASPDGSQVPDMSTADGHASHDAGAFAEAAEASRATDAPTLPEAARAVDATPVVDVAPVVDVPQSGPDGPACLPEPDEEICRRSGSMCGAILATDNCGQARTAICGLCGQGLNCDPFHKCVCASESAANLCRRNDVACGSYAGVDNCGRDVVASCGPCPSGQRCNGQNRCECAPESDLAFCARLGKSCGGLVGVDNCGASRTVADCGDCDDGDACTRDLCDDGACRHVSLAACTGSCDSSEACGATDSDGDGLRDLWESNGYVDVDCNGRYDVGVDTPLPDADVDKPNIYVKWDYMVETRDFPSWPHTHEPGASAMSWAKAILSAHDVILTYFPDHDILDEHAVVSASPPDALPACAGEDAVSFYAIKAAHFPAYLAPAYHYGIFAHYNTCSSDIDCAACPITPHTVEVPSWMTSESSGIAVVPGRDFIISLGYMEDGGLPMTDLHWAGAFLHQLGHTMGLRNGGGDDLDYKPNYISVMNTSYQFGIGRLQPWNPSFPWMVIANNPASGFTLDFSTFAAATLHEGSDLGSGNCGDDGSGGLDEAVGVATPDGYPPVAIRFSGPSSGIYYGPSGGHPIDWDVSHSVSRHVYRDISGDGKCSDLPGFDDMALATSGPGVTKLAHFQPNAACAEGYWTNGTAQP